MINFEIKKQKFVLIAFGFFLFHILIFHISFLNQYDGSIIIGLLISIIFSLLSVKKEKSYAGALLFVFNLILAFYYFIMIATGR